MTEPQDTPQPQDPPRPPRKDCRYNARELEQILPFKEAYVKAVTKPQRVTIMKTSILPTMFGYWASIGKDPVDPELAKLRASVSSSLRDVWKEITDGTNRNYVIGVRTTGACIKGWLIKSSPSVKSEQM